MIGWHLACKNPTAFILDVAENQAWTEIEIQILKRTEWNHKQHTEKYIELIQQIDYLVNVLWYVPFDTK